MPKKKVLAWGRKLRSRKESSKIQKRAVRARHFPAHDKRPEVIRLLKETKAKKNMSLKDIRKECEVSQVYVNKVNREEKILSPEELVELRTKIRNDKMEMVKWDTLYKKAREMIGNTNLSFAAIARKLKIRPGYVEKVNKGRGKDKQIRSREKILENAFGLKPIKHFSTEEKLLLVEGMTPFIISILNKRKVEKKNRSAVIDIVKDMLFRKLDYFDPKESIPVEALMKFFASRYYMGKALKKIRSKKEASFRRDKGGQIMVTQVEERQPLEIVINREVIALMAKVLDEKERYVLIKISRGRTHKQIARDLKVSQGWITGLKKRAVTKLQKALNK